MNSPRPMVSAVWCGLPEGALHQLNEVITRAVAASPGPGLVFFRADDIAVPGQNLSLMLGLFRGYGVPLCCSVVPAWLSRPRWKHLKGLAGSDTSLWCWHQHGWRHVNHETTGRKQEFGPSRSREELAADLRRGWVRLESVMEDDFFPVFTPPWNRCNGETLELALEIGYHGVSRIIGSRPYTVTELPDLQVNVDLHTRRETEPVAGWKALMLDLELALSKGFCGIMIHHQRMNEAALEFLEILLATLTRSTRIRVVHFRDLLNSTGN
jgi:peptidoglycan/xylan/chitin deacetylase (PgdA/CDA1 family)